jgi:hypothetical protein
MATEKQIAANRANAKRSTGPKTPSGKRRSSGNAFKHGLSVPLPDDLTTMAAVAAMVYAVHGSAENAGEEAAIAFARSQTKLQRVQAFRRKLLSRLMFANADADERELRMLRTLDRYERIAQTERRRASRSM